MANGYGSSFLNRGDSRSVADEDFDEEDVWSVVVHKESGEAKNSRVRKSIDVSNTTRLVLPVAPPTMIPKSLVSEDKNNRDKSRYFQQSAPVSIPDWSKMYWKGFENEGDFRGSWIDGGGDDDEVDDDKIPPHELIAKKIATSQVSAFSVCEGAGRTLKGRDLSKVRNAVLSRTGFLE